MFLQVYSPKKPQNKRTKETHTRETLTPRWKLLVRQNVTQN
jgi:hypothetical protein